MSLNNEEERIRSFLQPPLPPPPALSCKGSVRIQGENPKEIILKYFLICCQHWCLQQITVPSNFKKILEITNEGKAGVEGDVKVICVGLSRTGTSSLKAALSVLLPGLTYHGMDFLNEINNKVNQNL